MLKIFHHAALKRRLELLSETDATGQKGLAALGGRLPCSRENRREG
jgi:hypothetical protein